MFVMMAAMAAASQQAFEPGKYHSHNEVSAMLQTWAAAYRCLCCARAPFLPVPR